MDYKYRKFSYGGYASAMALAREDSPFQCGISVAPVTDWRLYSSVYTERFLLNFYQVLDFRYLGDYSENREWYDQDSSLLYDIVGFL